jgi:hypothetical protein
MTVASSATSVPANASYMKGNENVVGVEKETIQLIAAMWHPWKS